MDCDGPLSLYPVLKQWFKLPAEPLDSVAVLHHAAAQVTEVDSELQPVRVDRCHQGPYDILITLSGGRSVGLPR